MTHTIQDFEKTKLNRGLITPDYRDAHTAIIKFDNGDWVGVSRYDDEDYWIVDCAFRANGMPLFSNGTGSRITGHRAIADEDILSDLNSLM